LKRFAFFLSILPLLFSPLSGAAAVPELKEQLVYTLNLFNGRGYTQSFIPRYEDTIYLLADEDNAVSPRLTQVYFWDISRRYVAAFNLLNEEGEGTLEVLQGEKVIKTVEKEENVLFYSEGFLGEVSQMVRGEEARRIQTKYETVMRDYYDQATAYFKATEKRKRKLESYAAELARRKEGGERLTPEQVEAGLPPAPKPPETPRYAVSPMRKEYILHLPPGAYEIQLRAKDGTILEESKKKVEAFSRRRQGGVGYEVIPENRWTVKENCDDPSKVIYAVGENILFLRPFIQDEYNELYYKKLLDPQNEGSRERWIWVHNKPIEDLVIALSPEGEPPEKIKRLSYFVKQTKSSQLGYVILPYREEDFPGSSPTFAGYKLVFSANRGSYEFCLEKSNGGILEGSQRKILRVKKERAHLLYFVSIFPLLIGTAIFLQRKKSTS